MWARQHALSDSPEQLQCGTRIRGQLGESALTTDVVLDVNKNQFAQVNYGSGKDVSDESVADAGEPLRVSWHTDSFIEVPLGRR